MNRRHILKTLPLLCVGPAAFTGAVCAGEDSPRPLCLEYLDRVAAMFAKIRDTQADMMLEASYHIARTYGNGGHCFCQWETGHSFDGDMFPDRPGDTDLFIMGYTMGKPSVEPKSGDLLLVSVLRQPLEDPRALGIFVIGGPTPWCGDTADTYLLTEQNRKLRIKPYSDIWIETFIPTLGAIMRLPGETAPVGPTSGALGMVTYWAMSADAVRILARDKTAVTVKGDEPALGDNAGYVSPDTPLGARYIDECIRQVGQIEAECGTIETIARAAADCILSGGKLCVYSRHPEALSSEANGKRGGLALINTTFAGDEKFRGTERDFMIMGIYKPDHETDLAMLKKYRSMGMKIASIGPATRDGAVPTGVAVPRETDYHLGYMCDTYGIFAVPGVERKVCPTSGILVNLMFWSTMIRLAGEIIGRTGTTPGVLSTGAVIGGAEQRKRRTEVYKVRGY